MEKMYSVSNKAPIGCNDCHGCSECCHEMGDSIIQDPYDCYNFCSHMKLADGSPVTFDILISEDGPWELSEHDTLLLPNLKMVEPGVCHFLNESGRCSIHRIRSGLCRLYPLARQYDVSEDGHTSISYFILGDELGCPVINSAAHPSKILIAEWIGIPDIDKYERFLIQWHDVRSTFKALAGHLSDEGLLMLQQLLLNIFYEKAYSEDFYTDFASRVKIWEETVSRLS